jgi:hypothetical protein
MTRVHALLLPLIALALAACPTTAASRPEIPSTHIDPAVPLEGVRGLYQHPGSGVYFPPSMGRFVRVSAHRFDVESNNISVGYNHYFETQFVYGTLYVYPAPASYDARTWFESVEIRDIERAHEHARLIARETLPATFRGEPVTVESALFELDMPVASGVGDACSMLSVFRAGPWLVKSRFSMHRERVREGMELVEGFLAGMRLPPTGFGVP